MVTIITEIWFPEIVNKQTSKIRQDLKVIHGQGTAFFVNPIKGKQLGAGAVQPIEFLVGAYPTFIDMNNLAVNQRLNKRFFKRSKITVEAG